MDNVIESFEYYDYRPPLSEDINELGSEFPIVVYNEDIVTHPHKSKLIINGKLTVKKTGDKPDDPLTDVTSILASKLHFIYNGILHLFDRIDYYIGDNKVDFIRKPGYATTLKNLVSMRHHIKDDDVAGFVLHPGPITNLDNHDNVTNTGYFTFCIPLSAIMGIFEDNEKYIIRMSQKLVLTRSTTSCNNCLYSEQRDYRVSLNLKEIIWRIPQVKFTLAYENQLRKEILKSTSYELLFRHWYYQNISPPAGSTEFTWDLPVAFSKTKYVLIGFQHDRQDQLLQQNEYYDFLDTESIQVVLNNNVYYPRERLNLKYSELKCATAYEMMKAFRESYYGKKDCGTSPGFRTFVEKYPIFVIDCSHQPSVIKESLINIKILFSWRTAIPNNKVVIHCLMIMDRKVVYNPLTNTVLN